MSEIPALDTLNEMSKEFEGKTEDEILDIVSKRTDKMSVVDYNKLPMNDGMWIKEGQLARVKECEKKEGDFVFVLKCETIDISGDEPEIAIRGKMFLLTE